MFDLALGEYRELTELLGEIWDLATKAVDLEKGSPSGVVNAVGLVGLIAIAAGDAFFRFVIDALDRLVFLLYRYMDYKEGRPGPGLPPPKTDSRFKFAAVVLAAAVACPLGLAALSR